MAGLLDLLNTEDGRFALGLLDAGSAKPVRTSFGSGLLQAMNQAEAWKAQQEDRKQRAAMQAMQMQQIQMQQARQQAAEQQAAQMQQRRGSFLDSVDPSRGPAMPPSPAAALSAGLSPQEFGMLIPDPTKRDIRSVGDSLVEVGANGATPLYTAPQKPEKKPEALRILAEAFGEGSPQYLAAVKALATKTTTHQPAPSTNVSYGAPMAGVDAQGRPIFFQPSKDGGPPSIVSGVSPPKQDKPLTEAQAKAAAFVSQMTAAEKEFGNAPYDQSKLWSQVDVGLASGPTNLIASQAGQRARQAQEQFAEAFLRFKTGAASTHDEVQRNIRTYFPQPGDGADVVEQKRRMREQAIRDVGTAAGPGSAAPTGAPQIGEVRKGYRFKGGNPADRNNWEPVK
jgi:type II secretory pathway pseudopilin PulG